MPFSPSDVAGLFAWWVADTIALADGATVTSWSDSSGNSRTLTGVGAPIYKTAGLNSLPTVRFPGSATNYMYRDSMTLNQPCTAFFVARRTAATGSTGSILAGTPTLDVAMFVNGSQVFGVFAGSTGGLSVGSASATVGHVFEVRLNGSSGTAGVDGPGSTYNHGNNGFNGITLGARASRNGEWYDGDVAEVILYSGAVSSADASSLRSYLGAKYAIPVSGYPRPRRGLNYGALLQV